MGLLRNIKEALGHYQYRIDRDFRPAVDLQEHFFLPVEITTGPWKGVKFSYEDVTWNKVIAAISVNGGEATPAGERMVATYNLTIITEGPKSEKARKNVEKFRAVADDIWLDYSRFIMENHNKIREQVLNDERDEDGTVDIEESLNPRGVRKKGTSSPVARVRAKQKRHSSIGGNDRVHSSVQPVADSSNS